MKKLLVVCVAITATLLVSGCSTGRCDKCDKDITVTQQISAQSKESVMSAVMGAADKQGWYLRVYDIKKGYAYMTKSTGASRYTIGDGLDYGLEVQVPENGKGDVSVKARPPFRSINGVPTEPGALLNRSIEATPDKVANDFLVALKKELAR